jgi:DNA polymerase-3 subunit alpha (Gram-positive type)
MRLNLKLDSMVPPVVLNLAQNEIKTLFNLTNVNITPIYPTLEPIAPVKKQAKVGETLFGKPPKGELTKIAELNQESGRVVIHGEIFAVDTKEIAKTGAVVLSFDITDNTGSIRVSKYIKGDGDKAKALEIKKGMYVRVKGNVTHDRYYNDMVVEPDGIALDSREQRKDTSEEKRVELHLHTRMSAMDALTDTKAVINRAISWGHPAIAITDHGVCQSFPDAMKAAGDKIKVIYGVEGYYINDVDDRWTVFGETDAEIDCEIAAFDIETTGLDSLTDRITEIGAVIMKDGREIPLKNPFVNNLQPHPSVRSAAEVRSLTVTLPEIREGDYLAVAAEGEHGWECAWCAADIGTGEPVGFPDRAPAYQSNVWEHLVRRGDANHTFYLPLAPCDSGR